MQKAYECKVEYSRDGKCLRREWSVGAIVPWALVALVAIWSGHALVSLPASFFQIFK
jgi:hypothetical protein